jgi:hypothetical protein
MERGKSRCSVASNMPSTLNLRMLDAQGRAPDADDLRDGIVPQAFAQHTLADHAGRAEQSHSHT